MSAFKEDCRRLEVFPFMEELAAADESVRLWFATEVDRIKCRQRKYLAKRSTRRLIHLFASSWFTAPVRSQLIFEVLNRRAFQTSRRRYLQANTAGEVR